MTTFTIRIASHIFNVGVNHARVIDYFIEYLCDADADFSLKITPEDILFERSKRAHEDEIEGKPVINLPDELYEFTAVQRKIANILVDCDVLLLHGSVVSVDGKAYLFTAKSGTGKSTHTRLWREQFGDRAIMVNDDKPFLHITDQGVFVYGTPWNGKHRLGSNICVPLKGVCMLERGAENRIHRVSASDVLPMLIQQTHRPPQPHRMPKYLDLIDSLTRQMPFWRMECNMEPQAALVSYEAMSGHGKDDRQ